MLVQACTTSFILSLPENGRHPFRFNTELDTVGGFCKALLMEVGRMIAYPTIRGGVGVMIKDALTGEQVNV